MAARSKARKRAVDVLYAADLRGRSRLEQLADEAGAGRPPLNDYTVRLVEGVDEHAAEIDRLIDEYASGWSLERLPDVDRAILRLATFELLWADDVPDPVAIDEAVQLAKALSTDDSPAFVNGVLGTIAEAPASSSDRTTPRPRAVPDER